MPSKLKKAIAAVKDQTSISLAKVGGADSSSLEVAILKATTHDEIPIDERHVTEVLQHVSSNRSYAGSCARAIGRRIGRTRNWVVAVKSLMLVLRIFQDGDPHFPKEVLHAMKRGYKILNLASFRDDSSTSCPWDFTAFVRTFALYLDERLDCFLTGKLQRRTSHRQGGQSRGYCRKNVPFVRDMKPGVLLDRISHWQRLLDRAIATRPTGAAKANRLVQTCLYAIVQETFELYRDISDGLALLLDSFFHLQYHNCVSAFQTCVKASRQFQELCSFFDLCKSIGVGRTSEYPSVQKISDELVETLQEFLKDQSSFPNTNGRTPGIPPLSPKDSDSGSITRPNPNGRDRTMSEFGGSQCTSLEDLISADSGFSPDRYSDPGRENYPPRSEEYLSANDTASIRSDPTDHRGLGSVLDLLSLDGPSPPPELQDPANNVATSTSSQEQQGWELVLFDVTNQQPSQQSSDMNHDNSSNNTTSFNNAFEMDLFRDMNNAPSTSTSSSQLPSTNNNYSNPFLEDTISDLNGTSGGVAPPVEGDFFGSFTQTNTNINFPEGGFPGDIGLGVVTNNATSPTFHADFGNASISGIDRFSGGFDADTSISPATTAPPTFKADFGDGYVNGNGNVDANLNFLAPTFHAEVSNNGNSQSLPFDLFGELSNGYNTIVHEQQFDHHPNLSSATLSPTSVSTSGLSNGIAQPTFSTDTRDGDANAMNAIVPFGQPSNDDFFSSGPRFGAAPTFRATSVDFDDQQHGTSFQQENDLFGSFSSMPDSEQKMSGSLDQDSLFQQQQLWLQNQNKIIAKHLT